MKEQTTASKEESIDVRIPMPWGHIVGRWYGNRNVRPLLALHGWLDNMGTWNNLLPLLPAHIGVLCIDLPGHGRSSKLPNGIVYHAVHYVCVILQIMQAYNWTKVSILAHSMSAMISFVFTALYPQKVDLVICIDVVRSNYFKPNIQIDLFRQRFEKLLIEDDRQKDAISEPPSYTYEKLEKLLYEGSGQSVELENCRHILERNITKSQLYPFKYYFSRDGRIKYFFEFTTSEPFAIELASRIRDVPYCVIKGSKSHFINEDSKEVIAILRANNPHFEFHIVDGTHHVHLNDAASVAAIISPFISRHRPPLLNSWTLDEDETENENQQRKRSHKPHNGKGNGNGNGNGNGKGRVKGKGKGDGDGDGDGHGDGDVLVEGGDNFSEQRRSMAQTAQRHHRFKTKSKL